MPREVRGQPYCVLTMRLLRASYALTWRKTCRVRCEVSLRLNCRSCSGKVLLIESRSAPRNACLCSSGSRAESDGCSSCARRAEE